MDTETFLKSTLRTLGNYRVQTMEKIVTAKDMAQTRESIEISFDDLKEVSVESISEDVEHMRKVYFSPLRECIFSSPPRMTIEKNGEGYDITLNFNFMNSGDIDISSSKESLETFLSKIPKSIKSYIVEEI